jgi:hypothetical protein
MIINPLQGDYCPPCCESLAKYILKPGSIVPMCREDLAVFMKNGDYDKVCEMVQKSSSPEEGTKNV